MNTFERHKDPIVSVGIGKKSLYWKLSAGSIIKLISTKGFDPTMGAKIGDTLAIYSVDQNPYRATDKDKDSIKIFYHLTDGPTGPDQWIITPEFFMEYFEVIKI